MISESATLPAQYEEFRRSVGLETSFGSLNPGLLEKQGWFSERNPFFRYFHVGKLHGLEGGLCWIMNKDKKNENGDNRFGASAIQLL